MPDDEDDIEVFKYAENCQLLLMDTLTYMNMQIFVILIC